MSFARNFPDLFLSLFFICNEIVFVNYLSFRCVPFPDAFHKGVMKSDCISYDIFEVNAVLWLPKLIVFLSFLLLGQITSNCFALRTFADLMGFCLSRCDL